jgi:hypothetical protein
VDDLALGVFVVGEGDDGGLAAARVDAELGVQVRGGQGAELGDLKPEFKVQGLGFRV